MLPRCKTPVYYHVNGKANMMRTTLSYCSLISMLVISTHVFTDYKLGHARVTFCIYDYKNCMDQTPADTNKYGPQVAFLPRRHQEIMEGCATFDVHTETSECCNQQRSQHLECRAIGRISRCHKALRSPVTWCVQQDQPSRGGVVA